QSLSYRGSVAHLRNDTPQSAALSAFVPLRIPRLVSMRPPRPGCTCGLSRPPERTRTSVTQSEQPQLPASHPPLHLLCRDPGSRSTCPLRAPALGVLRHMPPPSTRAGIAPSSTAITSNSAQSISTAGQPYPERVTGHRDSARTQPSRPCDGLWHRLRRAHAGLLLRRGLRRG